MFKIIEKLKEDWYIFVLAILLSLLLSCSI